MLSTLSALYPTYNFDLENVNGNKKNLKKKNEKYICLHNNCFRMFLRDEISEPENA